MVPAGTAGVAGHGRGRREPAAGTAALRSSRHIAHAREISGEADDVAHLRGRTQHGHDARRRCEKVLLVSPAVRSVGRTGHGRQVGRPAGASAGIGISIGEHCAGTSALPSVRMLCRAWKELG